MSFTNANLLLILMHFFLVKEANAFVVGYEFDFSKADYIISGQIVRCATLGSGYNVIDLYEVKVSGIIEEKKVADLNRDHSPLQVDCSLTFIYARHEGWDNPQYSAMVGGRKKLPEGGICLIPIKFDDKLEMYTIFDKFYDIILNEDLITIYINIPKGK